MRGGVTDGVRRCPIAQRARPGCRSLGARVRRVLRAGRCATRRPCSTPTARRRSRSSSRSASEAFFVAPGRARARAAANSTACSPGTTGRIRPAASKGARRPPSIRCGASRQAVAGSAFGLSLFARRLDVEQTACRRRRRRPSGGRRRPAGRTAARRPARGGSCPGSGAASAARPSADRSPSSPGACAACR